MFRRMSIKRFAYIAVVIALIANVWYVYHHKGRLIQQSVYSDYVVEVGDSSLLLPLLEWDVWGSISVKEDSLMGDSLAAYPFLYRERICSDTVHHRESCGKYTPLFNQLDLKEVYNVPYNDTTRTLDERVSYLFTGITIPRKDTLYLEVKCVMPMSLWLNGDSLVRRDIQGLNIYQLPLKEGENRLTVKLLMAGDDHSFEAQLCDKKNIARLYAEGQSGNIIFPLIHADSEIIMLTNAHQNVVDSPVTLEMYNAYGERIDCLTLTKDSFTYHIPVLEKDMSYMCHLTMEGTTVRQPVLCGKDDDAYIKFTALRQSIPDNHTRAMEIDQVLYRLNFLLHHPTRSGDWWWQFKISPLSYQLEHLFAHLNRKPGESMGESNVQFMTYRSRLDESVQRYLLVTPNELPTNKKSPLVVIIRPNIDNHHHFFAAPQLARQWAVNIAQILANRHGYIVMMPEARIYHNEDLTPMAEAEIKLAMKEVMSHYPVDENRVYLHANCSGGYRALRLATENPKLFAAIGLYAPAYDINHPYEWSQKRKPELGLKNLKGIPIMIHGDPYDEHSPYQLYKDLVDDCHRNDIPLELSIKRNSGKFYNVVVVGEEAFDFFEGKERDIRNIKKSPFHSSEMVIADLYGEPFTYVYRAADHSPEYREVVDSIRSEYEHYLFTTIPLLADTLVNQKIVERKNLFLIGDQFDNELLNLCIDSLESKEDGFINKGVSLRIYDNPVAKWNKIAIYRAASGKTLKHVIHYPWKDGLKREITIHL